MKDIRIGTRQDPTSGTEIRRNNSSLELQCIYLFSQFELYEE